MKFVAPLLLLTATLGSLHAQTAKPNIVVMLVDDMGWSDLACYGSELKTPNLDALAKNGLRFTQFYNGARCCPTRASLLTGLYAHQAGVGHMTEERRDENGKVRPGYSGRLNDTSVTIPEVLGKAGYFTAMTGKWHVGQNHGVKPEERGFQRTLTAAAGGFYFPDSRGTKVFYNGKDVGKDGDPLPKDWYASDLWPSFGLKFIDEAIAEKKPFFLYNAFNAPHFPLQAPAEDIARWRGKFKVGWDKLREERYRRQIESGLIDSKWPLSARPEDVPAWDSLSAEDQDRYDHLMAIYAAVIERMDKGVGILVKGLRQRGQLDNTLILFLSDNGGNAEQGVRGRSNGDHLGDAQSDVFIGKTWATLNNTPFVRYKHYTDEGGISTPLIVHWPAVIKDQRRGALEKQPGHLIDILATAVDVAGAEYPAEFKGKAITPKEGVSLLPAFKGEKLARTAPIFWEHEGNRAVREGDLKLVALEDQPWRLYDLAADRSEQHDLAAGKPEIVKELAAKWDTWAARAKVLPLGAWRDSGAGNPQGSAKRNFELKTGDRLEKNEAPDLRNRAITLTADFDAPKGDGVIIAQGGTLHGLSLSIHEGKLVFFLRSSGDVTRVELPGPFEGPVQAEAKLARDGKVTLSAGGKEATATRPGLLGKNPADGLSVGDDSGPPVGPYKTAEPFAGTIRSVRVALGPK
ncbi:arylsulfatase [Luteolibacter sp. Populi]|uniref:arylsulfatase n=1 Tax=Luteolibacter sp. Populi TaxID=3230487 RepID=UPI0034679D05